MVLPQMFRKMKEAETMNPSLVFGMKFWLCPFALWNDMECDEDGLIWNGEQHSSVAELQELLLDASQKKSKKGMTQ
jgi:hypothetical protein